MSEQISMESPISVVVDNIGGIDETAVEFTPGVTVLVGRNATNRTSFLQALMAALGSENVALKGDAEEGSVELTFDDSQYTRTLSRRQGTVVFDGNPYLDGPEVADLFAFLLESNEARQAVERGDDLYDVIMRPVDTDEIDDEIDRLEAERDELERELEELEALERRLPELEEERTRVRDELETKQDELEAKQDELEALEADSDTTEIEEQFEALRETRTDLESLRADREDEARIVEALEEERAELEEALDGLAAVDDDALDDLETTISRHRTSIQTIESTISELQSVIQFNESMLDGARGEVLDSLADDDSSVTDQLVDDGEAVVCWTCGSEVERDQIGRTIDLLQDAHSEKVHQRSELREEIEELEAERKHIERTREEHRRLSRQLEEVEADLEERTDRLVTLEDEAEGLEADVAELEATVEALETDEHDERLAKHREVNELEFELDRLQSRLDDIDEEIDAIEAELGGRGTLEDRRDEIDDEIEALRSRIERLETDAVESFNEQMDRILDLLEFENLERVWIERLETEVNQGRGSVTKPTFDLHVVRTADSGSVYEDTVDHLSESEREVVGLVFALSGFLVHEVYDQVPFMLLDSLEAIDSERIAVLIDHLAEQASNLVVALLPEDAGAVDDEYERVVEI